MSDLPIPYLPFTQAQSDHANEFLGANCGPHSLSAASGFDLTKCTEAIPDFMTKRFTNPTMMHQAIGNVGLKCIVSKGLHVKTLPEWGVARVQWEGSFLDRGVHPAAAYRHTHWVASKGPYVFCTVMPRDLFGWQDEWMWKKELDAFCTKYRYRGWHVTHQYLFL